MRENLSLVVCDRCNMNYVNIIDHCISECPYVHLERVSLWDKIYQFNPDVYMFLMRLDKETLTTIARRRPHSVLVFLSASFTCHMVEILPRDGVISTS